MSERPTGAQRVSNLELFFDLVFVFTITQLTTVLARRPTLLGLAQVVLMLGVIWWMYGGYVWLTNSVPPDGALRRGVLLGGMAAFLVQALTIPRAFSGEGLSFGIAYLAVVLVHLGLFAGANSGAKLQAIKGLAPYNVTTAVLVVVGGALGGGWQYGLWTTAFVAEWITPKLIRDEEFDISPRHFVERHGLVILVAIGESVVGVGIGAASEPVHGALVAFAVLGLALSAALWWCYFGGDEGEVERAFTDLPTRRRPEVAIDAFGYCFLGLLLGVVVIAAAEKRVALDPGEVLAARFAIGLAAGVALYVLCISLFRRSLGLAVPGGGSLPPHSASRRSRSAPRCPAPRSSPCWSSCWRSRSLSRLARARGLRRSRRLVLPPEQRADSLRRSALPFHDPDPRVGSEGRSHDGVEATGLDRLSDTELPKVLRGHGNLRRFGADPERGGVVRVVGKEEDLHLPALEGGDHRLRPLRSEIALSDLLSLPLADRVGLRGHQLLHDVVDLGGDRISRSPVRPSARDLPEQRPDVLGKGVAEHG
ncbi:MAG: low temperature requirement protein A, partial [Actinomycetota bacterium]|nr:low temperature requirement protein A [Actinomycetota bacterium]